MSTQRMMISILVTRGNARNDMVDESGSESVSSEESSCHTDCCSSAGATGPEAAADDADSDFAAEMAPD